MGHARTARAGILLPAGRVHQVCLRLQLPLFILTLCLVLSANMACVDDTNLLCRKYLSADMLISSYNAGLLRGAGASSMKL